MILKYSKVIIVVLVGIGLLAAYFSMPYFAPQDSLVKEEKKGADVYKPLVEIEQVTVQPFQENLVSVGSLVANESVVLRPEIEGKLLHVFFEPGTHVEKGTNLFRLDDSILRSQLEEAKAQLKLSELEYERAKLLAEKKVGPMKEMQKSLATFEVQKSNLAVAKEKLEKSLIKAPFEGLIGMKDISVGAYVRPGEDLVVLEDVDPMKVDFNVGEVYLQDLKVGMPVKVKVDGFDKKEYTGKIEAIDARVDTVNHSIRVRASMHNEDRKLRSGLFASVKLTVRDEDKAILVPESAVEQRNGEQVVYRIIENVAVETPVTVGPRRDGLVVIEDGLFSYDVVATAGASKLQNGVPVKTTVSSRLGAQKEKLGGIVEKLRAEGSK